ncbi:MAG: DEAD/DEAH box helicase [Bacillus subtilis]|nr:DEAD/DEAH box helicase [Bacillus subtilis]
MMFSATMPRTILGLAKSYMNDPEMVKVIGDESTNSDIVQYYYKVKHENKTEAHLPPDERLPSEIVA